MWRYDENDEKIMALNNARRIGGIILILSGIFFIIAGSLVVFFGNSDVISFVSIFFQNVPSVIFIVGVIHIIFGVFLVWMGRLIRNEPFLPKFMK